MTHKSTEKKIREGARIIEIKIESEQDVEQIIINKRIDGRAPEFVYDKTDLSNTLFYNFKASQFSDPNHFKEIYPNYIYYMWLINDGKFKIDKCPCNENPLKHIPINAHYIISDKPISFDWCFIEFIKKGIKVTNCLVCKYTYITMLGDRICTLYKKFGTPMHPPIYTAKNCQYFRLRSFQEPNIDNKFLSDKPNLTIVIRKKL